MKKSIICLLLLLGIVGLLTGCQTGSQAIEPTPPEESEQEKAPEVVVHTQNYADSFVSTDGKTEFSVNVFGAVHEGTGTSVEVEPHAITAQEAQQFAQVFFGDADLYETVFIPPTGAAETVETVPCQWTYYPLEHYLGGSEELYLNGKKQILAIDATTECNGIAYKYVVTTRDEDDFLLNNINIFLSSHAPTGSQDKAPTEASLCGTAQPSEAQLKVAEEQAAKILDELELGKWEIVECYAEEFFGTEPVYRICVNAVPALGTGNVLRYPYLQNVAVKTDNATEYLQTDAHFAFSGNGDLLACTIQSPIDVVKTNEPATILDFDTLMSAAKTAFSTKDYSEYAWQVSWDTSRNYNCKVNVTGFIYGLTRTEVPDNNKAFSYVPSVTFYGNYQVYDAANGTQLYDSETIADGEDIPLLVLNAYDGTVVPMQSDKLS